MLPSHRWESRAVIGATTGFADNRSGISKHTKTFRSRIRFVSLGIQYQPSQDYSDDVDMIVLVLVLLSP
jgi:hypothetical protein